MSEDTYDSPFGEPTLLASSLIGTTGSQSDRNGIIVQWAKDRNKGHYWDGHIIYKCVRLFVSWQY